MDTLQGLYWYNVGEMNQIPQLCINGKEMKPYVDNLTGKSNLTLRSAFFNVDNL